MVFKQNLKNTLNLLDEKNKNFQCNDETNQFNKNKENISRTENLSLSDYPTAFTLLPKFLSPTYILGFLAEAYHYGLVYCSLVPTLVIMPAVGAFCTGPFFANLGVKSVFEYLEMRFNSLTVRQLAVVCYLLRTVVSASIHILGLSILMNVLSDLNVKGWIIAIGIISIMIGISRLAKNSYKFNYTIMFLSFIFVIINGIIDVGGIKKLWEINYNGGRLNVFDFDLNPFIRQSFWSINIASIFIIGNVYCIDQQMLQRFVSAKSKRAAKIGLLLNSPGLIIWIGLCFLIGLITYAKYHGCDPLSTPSISKIKNQSYLVSYYVKDSRKRYGLLSTSLIFAFCNSMSSTFNSVSVILSNDIFKKFQNSTVKVKLFKILFGFMSTSIAFPLVNLRGNLLQISNSILGSLEAPIIGIFILASLLKLTNKYGAIIGMLSGLLVSFWLSIGVAIVDPIYKTLDVGIDCYINSSTVNYTIIVKNDTLYTKEAINVSGFNKIYSISYNYFGPFCVAVTVLVGISVSLLTRCHQFEHVDDKYILYKWSKAKPSNQSLELIG